MAALLFAVIVTARATHGRVAKEKGGRALRRLRIVVFLVGVLIVMMVPATSAFAIVITPTEDRFSPGQGPSFNAKGGLVKAVEKTRGKGNSDIVIVKLIDKGSPS